MIKTIIKAIYSAFISIVLISIILAGWTSYAFLSHSSKTNEIIKVIQDMYASQKSVVIDVIELSKILINDSSLGIDNVQLDQLPITEDNADNPLGIVIEKALPEVSEKTLPEIIDESLVDQTDEVSMNEMEIGIETK